jgi:quercetin dioxygenase-like cupin family protein
LKPYTDIKTSDNSIIREFGDDIDPIELMWHRDDEDRTVTILEGTDWQFQRDNELPLVLSKGVRIFIPKHEWHRVIKGTGKLKIQIQL